MELPISESPILYPVLQYKAKMIVSNSAPPFCSYGTFLLVTREIKSHLLTSTEFVSYYFLKEKLKGLHLLVLLCSLEQLPAV